MKIQNDLPTLQAFTDGNGQRWAFDDEAICYLETQEGAPFWHLYQYHDLENPTAERCAALLQVSLLEDAETGHEKAQ